MEQKLFEGSLSVINLGLPNFFAGGDVRLIEILDRLEELG